MKGFVQDIEVLAIKNSEFRQVLYTAKHRQLVVMSLEPKEEVGAELHELASSPHRCRSAGAAARFHQGRPRRSTRPLLARVVWHTAEGIG